MNLYSWFTAEVLTQPIVNKQAKNASSTTEATITVANKARGSLLDVIKMIAIAPDTRQERNQSDAHEDNSELVLKFEDIRCKAHSSLHVLLLQTWGVICCDFVRRFRVHTYTRAHIIL